MPGRDGSSYAREALKGGAMMAVPCAVAGGGLYYAVLWRGPPYVIPVLILGFVSLTCFGALTSAENLARVSCVPQVGEVSRIGASCHREYGKPVRMHRRLKLQEFS